MPIVSLSFLLTIATVAVVLGIINLASPNPIYELAALLLALYAVHGLGIRFAVRERGDPDEIKKQADHLRSELEQEREAREAERAERAEVEKQWIGLGSH